MKGKIIWLVVSCLMVAALLLASCAQTVTEEEEVTPPAEEEIAREIVHLETGEEKEITTTIPLSKYRYESNRELKVDVKAIVAD